MASTSFFVSWFVVLFLFGAGLYVFDRYRGVKVYRWFYDMTHKNPLDAKIDRGFIYNQKNHTRFLFAIAFSVMQSSSALIYEASTFAQEFLSVILEVPCLMLGFYIGPTFFKLWASKEKVFDKVDMIERGHISIQKEVKEFSDAAVSKIRETINLPETKEVSPQVIKSSPQPKVEPEPDPKSLISKYIKGS